MVLSFGADWMWRLIFAINVPIGLFALAISAGEGAARPADRTAQARFSGALLATAGLGLMAWGLTSFGLPAGQGILSPWRLAGCWALVLFAGSSSCGSAGRERR